MKQKITAILLLLLLIGCSTTDLEAGPPIVADTGIDPDSWALVPAGEFLEGQFNHETQVDYDYEIMVTLVTNDQFARYLNEALDAGAINIVDEQVVGDYPGDTFRAYRHEVEITAGDWVHFPLEAEGLRVQYDGSTSSFKVKDGYENHPVVLVSWFGARGYCEYFGWRLPTEVEWEKAARGTQGLPFPWGHDIEENNANYYSSRDPYEAILGKQGDTTPVGFYNGMTYEGYETIDSPSPYGLYDMAGNVEQWTGDVHENQHYRYLRGGSKAFYTYDLRVWSRNNAGPDYFSISIGFRCAREVDTAK